MNLPLDLEVDNREGAKNSGGKTAGLLPAQVITGNARRAGS